MCDSLQPAVGYNWGAGNMKRVRDIERCCFTAGAVLSIASAVVIFCFPSQITGLFLQNADSGVVELAVPALKLFSFAYLIRWFSFATQSYMSAVEKPVPAMMLSRYDAVRRHSHCIPAGGYHPPVAPRTYRPVAECPGSFPAGGGTCLCCSAAV